MTNIQINFLVLLVVIFAVQGALQLMIFVLALSTKKPMEALSSFLTALPFVGLALTTYFLFFS